MALKFFKRTTDQLFIFPNSTDEFQKHNRDNNNLTHVMHLFVEKNKYPPTVVAGPLPIKANGAIVVNRPNHRLAQKGTIRSLPTYLQDEDDDEEGEVEEAEEAEEEEVEEEADIGDMKMSTTDESTYSSCSSGSHPSIIEEVDMVDIVYEENRRLRQQIRAEREQHEKWRLGQEKLQEQLLISKTTIKNLERVNQRFQKLLLPPSSSTTVMKGHGRRKSMGVSFDHKSADTQGIIVSYERKLKILLDEIDAMEEEENEKMTELSIQKNECEKLSRKLKYKDDIIRQLAYDLHLLQKA